MSNKPSQKTKNPCFSSGPCPKHPGWSPEALKEYPAGRSHRSAIGKQRLGDAIEQTREFLNVPKDYRIGIFAGSDTGAFECAMWSMLGPKPIDVLVWESFSKGWATDITKELKLEANVYTSDYGTLPDLEKVNFDNDVVFAWNGTTAGVRVPDGEWIPDDRKGLTLCDATSALFAMDIPWKKIDVLSYSWQKCLGGEGAHGVLVLSPRAVDRILSYTPPWPMPKIFRMRKGDKLNEGIFKGSTINTPSMLCVEDYLDALKWGRDQGGLQGLIKRSQNNLAQVENWLEVNETFDFLARNRDIRSSTSVCLKVIDKKFTSLSPEDQKATAKKIEKLLAEEGVAFDINAYRDAPTGFRIWCGPTVESEDVKIALDWLSWAYDEVMK